MSNLTVAGPSVYSRGGAREMYLNVGTLVECYERERETCRFFISYIVKKGERYNKMRKRTKVGRIEAR